MAAASLLLEDELKKILHQGKNTKHQEKMSGRLPLGKDSVFGDFPTKLMPKKLLEKKKELNQLRPKLRTSPHSLDYRERSTAPRPVFSTTLRRFYDRGDLPLQIEHGTVNGKLSWKVDLNIIDYNHYLPIFLEGLREKEDPYRFVAVQGTYDLLDANPGKVAALVSKLIIPLKTALNTRDPEIICTVLKVMKAMIQGDAGVGLAMVPFYRQLLPVLNIYKNLNENIGDSMYYAQRKGRCLGDLIHELLELMETYGGDHAYINIKFLIPTYESAQI